MKNKIALTLGGIGLLMTGFAAGQGIDPNRNPNLFAAQQHCHEAWVALTAAQRANQFDLGGHAQRAKDLLHQAEGEIQAATNDVNRR